MVEFGLPAMKFDVSLKEVSPGGKKCASNLIFVIWDFGTLGFWDFVIL